MHFAGKIRRNCGKRLTLFEFEGYWHCDLIVLHERSRSQIIRHQVWEPSHCQTVREVCSGLGALGLGAAGLGFRVCARNDVQMRTVTWLRTQFPDTAAVCGDIISNQQVVSDVYEVAPGPAGIVASFSCQPFSLLGGYRGADDDRSKSLTGVLSAAYWLQASFVLVECVVPACTNAEVRRCLEAFTNVSAFVP